LDHARELSAQLSDRFRGLGSATVVEQTFPMAFAKSVHCLVEGIDSEDPESLARVDGDKVPPVDVLSYFVQI
jgi:hypothetical protein